MTVLRITGLPKKAELDGVQEVGARQWRSDSRVKVLVIAEAFQGWEPDADWVRLRED